jgi:hypothetical protein
MSAAPVFYITPRSAGAQCNGAAQTLKLPATADALTSIIVGAATGSMITRVHLASVASAGPTTANTARFYLLNGGNYYLVAEMAIGALTPSASVIGFHADIPDLVGRILPDANWSLVFGMGVAGAGNNIYVATADVLDA